MQCPAGSLGLTCSVLVAAIVTSVLGQLRQGCKELETDRYRPESILARYILLLWVEPSSDTVNTLQLDVRNSTLHVQLISLGDAGSRGSRLGSVQPACRLAGLPGSPGRASDRASG